jgi:hypothetical protein
MEGRQSEFAALLAALACYERGVASPDPILISEQLPILPQTRCSILETLDLQTQTGKRLSNRWPSLSASLS